VAYANINVSIKNWCPIKSIFEHDDGPKVNKNVEYLGQLNKYVLKNTMYHSFGKSAI